MARYIDEELLIEKMTRLRGCSCSYSDGIIDEVEDIMSDLPTADVIPLDKVKQARRELDKLPIYGAKFTDDFRIHLDREEVFSILDKLIAESEE